MYILRVVIKEKPDVCKRSQCLDSNRYAVARDLHDSSFNAKALGV